jgi:hypothetical protein
MAGRTFDPAVRGNRPLEMSKPTYRELATNFTLWCKFVALASEGGDKLVARWPQIAAREARVLPRLSGFRVFRSRGRRSCRAARLVASTPSYPSSTLSSPTWPDRTTGRPDCVELHKAHRGTRRPSLQRRFASQLLRGYKAIFV